MILFYPYTTLKNVYLQKGVNLRLNCKWAQGVTKIRYCLCIMPVFCRYIVVYTVVVSLMPPKKGCLPWQSFIGRRLLNFSIDFSIGEKSQAVSFIWRKLLSETLSVWNVLICLVQIGLREYCYRIYPTYYWVIKEDENAKFFINHEFVYYVE